MTKCHGLELKDSHNENNVGYEQNNASNDHTPIQPQLDTNILRVNNLYTYGIERLFTIYNINNNNIRAREFDEPSYVINLVNNKSKISESTTKCSQLESISESVTNCHELKLTDSEKQISSYADNAFGSLTKPTQSAFITTRPFKKVICRKY